MPGHTIIARYAGRCDACPEPIRPGDRIRYERDPLDYEAGVPVHDDCATAVPAERPVVICPDCHLQRPCECADLP